MHPEMHENSVTPGWGNRRGEMTEQREEHQKVQHIP